MGVQAKSGVGLFLSTLSLRRATVVVDERLAAHAISIHALLAESDYSNANKLIGISGISIHALLAESDRRWAAQQSPARHFYPRSPCGERRLYDRRQGRRDTFLSTLSLRRATSDSVNVSRSIAFLSTLSLRRATKVAFESCGDCAISIHALLAESDAACKPPPF